MGMRMENKFLDLMIVGAQKSGTTSLLRLLGKDPIIYSHDQIEFPLFVNDRYYSDGIEFYWDEYFQSLNTAQKIVGKSAGLMYSETALARLKEHNPDVKLVLIFRNPVQRAYSAYWFARRKEWEKIKTFEEALNADSDRFGDQWIPKTHCAYKERGKYSVYLKKIYSLFPKENILLFKFEELQENSFKVCQTISKSLGVNYEISTSKDKNKYNVAAMPKFQNLNVLLRKISPNGFLRKVLPMTFLRKAKRKLISLNETKIEVPPIKQETKEHLIKFYRDYNSELSELTGWDLSSWNK